MLVSKITVEDLIDKYPNHKVVELDVKGAWCEIDYIHNFDGVVNINCDGNNNLFSMSDLVTVRFS